MAIFECEKPVEKPLFFNRERELQVLISAVKDVEKGRGGIVLILGSKKMGKTSLIKEFQRISKQNKINLLILASTKQTSNNILKNYIISVAENSKRKPTILVIENIQEKQNTEKFTTSSILGIQNHSITTKSA